ncbi:MAG TPA: hypothetical protein VII64_05290 [Thermodesulfobacteriota bacterium]
MEKEAGMTAGGWIFLALSWGVVSGFVVFCFYRIFTKIGFK